jgi:hypothetical protein
MSDDSKAEGSIMKILRFALLFLAPTLLYGQAAFNGTWKFSPQSAQFSGKPTTFSLKNGMYRCDSCAPKLIAKADGQDQKRTGSPYADAVSVRAVDDSTIEVINKKNGKQVGKSTDKVSDDGNTLTSEWGFVSDNGQTGNGKVTSKRVAPAPSGAHKASGSWQTEKVDDASESVLTVTYTATEDGLSMSDMTGDSYTAKFDGKDYPYKGDPGVTTVALKKIDANTVEETDKRDGKVIFTSHMTVSSDGQTMSIENNDKLRGTSAKFEGKKQ